MFFPIIIPIYNRFDDDDDDRQHGSGCQCPECLEKKKWESMPREYYQYRYAIPKNFFIKNTIFKICRLLMILMGMWLIILSLYTIDYPMNLTNTLLPILLGFGIIIAGVVIFGNLIEWDFLCKDKIYLTADYFATKEDWDKIITEKNINKEKYKLTKIETTWRYK